LRIKIYRSIILPVIFYECKAWSVRLKVGRRLRVFGNYLYSLPNILRVVRSRILRWAEHGARMGKEIGVYRLLWGNLRERGHCGDPGVDGRIILVWIFPI
jgi:hypothetical protein